MNHNKYTATLLALCGILITHEVCGESQGQRETPEQKAARKERMYKKLGGRVINMATMKGTFAFVNAQTSVPSAPLAETVESMADFFMSDFRLIESPTPIAFETAGEAIKKTGAIYGVVLTAQKDLPPLVTVPDAKWAIVNVSALIGDEKLVRRRVKLEMWRALGYLCASNLDGCMLQPVSNLEQLDALPDALSQEALYRIPKHLVKVGITPYTRTTYKRACQEGWAHQPTNDVEKAIWDKVHAMPQNPMKIEFDPKKGR